MDDVFLNNVMLSTNMLGVVMLNIVMLSASAPTKCFSFNLCTIDPFPGVSQRERDAPPVRQDIDCHQPHYLRLLQQRGKVVANVIKLLTTLINYTNCK